jgi:phosphatidylserine/phosphatidylglycerophosphate/cardiolipin synthase-like enzyme
VGRYGAFASGGAAIEASLAGALGWAEAQRRASCDVVANYLTDYWVQDALVAAAHDGVALNVVVNPAAYGAEAASRWLERHGVTVLVAPVRPYLHAKVLVCAAARGAVAVVGSANFSYDAMHTNHELDATLSGRVAEVVWRWATRVAAEARPSSCPTRSRGGSRPRSPTARTRRCASSATRASWRSTTSAW